MIRKTTIAILLLFATSISLCHSQSQQEADIFYIISTEVLHAYNDS